MEATETKERGIIIRQGMGGFLNPPGHPEHSWSVEYDLQRRKDNRSSASLSHVVESEWFHAAIRASAARMLDEWEAHKLPLDSRECQLWIKAVQSHFKGCYKGTDDGKYGRGPWSAEALRIDSTIDPMLNIDLSASAHLIRQYYPEYMPHLSDFTAGCAACAHHINAHANGDGGPCTVIIGAGTCDCPRFSTDARA